MCVLSAQIITYAPLVDMLGDVNRTGVFTPNPLRFGVNIVGSGSDLVRINGAPEPGTLALLGLAGLAATRRRKQ